MTKSSFNITSKTLMAKGWSSLWQMKVDARLSNGTHVELDREVADHGHGASILPIDRERGTVLLVRQWRAGAAFTGHNGWLIETCAGLLDADLNIVKPRNANLGDDADLQRLVCGTCAT